MSATSRWTRRLAGPAWVSLSLLGLTVLAWILVHPEGRGTDAYSYWSWSPDDPYRQAVGNVDAPVAFRYAPPVGIVLLPLRSLSFDAFLWLWTALLLAALAWQARWWSFAALALYPVLLEVSVANVHLLLGAAIVAGFHFPEAWAFPLLTKVTPGIGILWFAVRREWRALARAVGATAVIAGVSFVVAPGWWSDWIAMLASNVGLQGGTSVPVPLLIRLPLAALIVAWGARTDRRWCVPIGSFLALPTIWPQSFALLVAIVPLVGSGARPRLRAGGGAGREELARVGRSSADRR